MQNLRQHSRLLVLDPEPELHEVIASICSSNCFIVDSVRRRIIAPGRFACLAPDVIVLTMRMPGFEVVRFLRMVHSSGQTPQILIICDGGDNDDGTIDTLRYGSDMPPLILQRLPIRREDLISYLSNALAT